MRLNVESKEMFKIDLDITNLRQDILGLTGSGIDIAKQEIENYLQTNFKSELKRKWKIKHERKKRKNQDLKKS